MSNTISGSGVGLRYAEETSPGVLPGTPVWYPEEPNSFSGFGAKVDTVARSPITEGRQRSKGTITGITASAGYEKDITQDNHLRQMQGFLFADAREKVNTIPLNGAAVVLTSVTSTQATAASGLASFLVNHLVLGSGFGVAANNSLHRVSVVAAGALTADNFTAEASPPATAELTAVGYEFASATLDVAIVGGLPRLTRSSGVFDLTTLGLVPGEWIHVGGDAAGTQFANNGATATASGWARVSSVAATYIELDKTSWTPQAETGTGKTIRIFFGAVVKNEATAALIKPRTFQYERTLGSDGAGTMSEYLPGSTLNEFTLSLKAKDKVTCSFGIVALSAEMRDGATGVKAGTRPALVSGSAFNTSTDVKRAKISVVTPTDPVPAPLAAYAEDAEISIKNGATPVDAIGTSAAIDTAFGDFEVSGKYTGYVTKVTPKTAILNNADVTFDLILARSNAGIAFDLPLIGVGDGNLSIEKGKAITIPLSADAYVSPKFSHTLLYVNFPYLPTVAAP